MGDSKRASPAAVRIASMHEIFSDIAIVFEEYKQNKVGAAGADEQIIAILFKRGYARKKQINVMSTVSHKLNRGWGFREQHGCAPDPGKYRLPAVRLERMWTRTLRGDRKGGHLQRR